ncbi:protein of unknown function [Desulfotomaculum arcticum]|uniref:DUF4422 domain-containing protein n=1 Tax=Desulfotruncus arcticus DSM 17038 TaxID=1121424 RepID=A0A1I2X004_9FIRM|nr:DUF4422 domain-containing protein [Desulfotruncus arcticus]SFH06904.1 protein of unknown function [Desulfotomaculum arcticum] [Desulfotruncus arcticus DSM 17038]
MSFSIKIYVSCHKDSYVSTHAMLFPIQVGAVLSKSRFGSMLYDDTGDNISFKNRSYCELTAQYWAWKNEEADFFGFFHYRRYLAFVKKSLVDCCAMPKKLPFAYKIYKLPDEITLEKLGYNTETMSNIISSYDVISPIAEEMYVSVYNHYQDTEFHDALDLDLVLEIIGEKYPEFQDAAQEYMNSTKHYFGNIYIMRKEIFHSYCKWLFKILETFDSRKDFSKYSGKAYRVDGYLGERLFGIYYTWLKKQPHVSWAELPRAHFEAFPGETDNFSVMKRINTFFPPGTRRRAWIKKLKTFN